MRRLIFSAAVDFIFPKKCALCGDLLEFREAGEMCSVCLEKYAEAMDEPCERCGMGESECRCSRERFREFHGEGRHTALGFYRSAESPEGKLVYRLKREYDRDLVRFFSRALAAKLTREIGPCDGWFVTYPPRSKHAKRKYGFDQSRFLAKGVAKYSGAAFSDTLVRLGGDIQKSLDYGERFDNAALSFGISPQSDVSGKRFILLDDVITTGATVGACAKILFDAGAREVYPASLFTTMRKKPEPKEDGLWFE